MKRQFGILVCFGMFMSSVYSDELKVSPVVHREAWEDESAESRLFIHSNIELKGLAILLSGNRLVPTKEHSQENDREYRFIYCSTRKFKISELKRFELHVTSLSEDYEERQRRIFVFTGDRSQKQSFVASDSAPENSYVPYDILKISLHQTPLGRDGKTLENEESRQYIEMVNEFRRINGRQALTYTQGLAFPDNCSHTEYYRLQDELKRTNQSPLGMLWTGSNDPYKAFSVSVEGSYAKTLLDPQATRADVYFGPEGSHFVTK